MSDRDHGSALDTLRWGDVQQVVGLEATFSDATAIFKTVQLNQAHWRWPLSWVWRLALTPQMPAVETGTFKVEIQVTLGVGQAQTTFSLFYSITKTGSVYLPVTDSQLFPAQDIQMRAVVTGAASQATVTDAIIIGSFLAPQTEPHAMTEMLERMQGKAPDQVEWMGEGFHPQALHYRR
jgi:hypothetical protein